MSFLKRSYAYSKMEIEDPKERAHRRAQILIYKVLEQADSHSRRRPVTLKVRICKLKVKIGRRLKTLRKNMLLNISKARINLYRKIMVQLKTLKCLIRSEEAMAVNTYAINDFNFGGDLTDHFFRGNGNHADQLRRFFEQTPPLESISKPNNIRNKFGVFLDDLRREKIQLWNTDNPIQLRQHLCPICLAPVFLNDRALHLQGYQPSFARIRDFMSNVDILIYYCLCNPIQLRQRPCPICLEPVFLRDRVLHLQVHEPNFAHVGDFMSN